jgi:hypothetical protein
LLLGWAQAVLERLEHAPSVCLRHAYGQAEWVSHLPLGSNDPLAFF